MDREPMDQLDALIEEALSSETPRPVPATFHRRLDNRLRIASLLETERRQFRYHMALLGIVTAAFGVTMVGLPLWTYFNGWLGQEMSGGMGRIDSSVGLTVLQGWETVGISGLVALTGATVAGAVMVALPRLSRSRSRT
jgi:hypothetical protein